MHCVWPLECPFVPFQDGFGRRTSLSNSIYNCIVRIAMTRGFFNWVTVRVSVAHAPNWKFKYMTHTSYTRGTKTQSVLDTGYCCRLCSSLFHSSEEQSVRVWPPPNQAGKQAASRPDITNNDRSVGFVVGVRQCGLN